MINPFIIIKAVEDEFNLGHGTLCGCIRTKTIANARATAMYLIRKLTSYSTTEVGDCFLKDHSSVIYNCKKCVKALENGDNMTIKNAIITITKKFEEEQCIQ